MLRIGEKRPNQRSSYSVVGDTFSPGEVSTKTGVRVVK